MNIYIFDLDDTILMHKQFKNGIEYNIIQYNPQIDNYLSSIQGTKYIYTNGTYGHADKTLQMMEIDHHFDFIYARDTLDSMKPEYSSFKQVYLDVLYRNNLSYTDPHTIFFYDDLLDNLKTAYKIGWKTIWIHPNHWKKYDFVNYSSDSILHI